MRNPGLSLRRAGAWQVVMAAVLLLAAVGAGAQDTHTFEAGSPAGWFSSSPKSVQVSVRPREGGAGSALCAQTEADRLYVGREWRFTESDSCLTFDVCSAGPSEAYFIQLGIRTADGREHWSMPALRPALGKWIHVRAPLTRTVSQALRGAEVTRVWIGQIRAEGAVGRHHSLLVDNVRLEHGVPQVTDGDAFLTAGRLREAPAIDGRLDEAAWQDVAPVAAFADNDGRLAARPVTIRVGYDAECLYFGIESSDDPAKLVARETQADGPVWGDDSIEVFLDPERDGSTYFQLAVNPLGTLYTQRGTLEKGGAVRLDTSWEPGCRVQAARSAEGWTAEFAVPFRDLNASPGGAWRLQVGRHRPGRENCSLFLGGKEWHRPAEWGLLLFGQSPPGLRLRSLEGRRLSGEVSAQGRVLLRADALPRAGTSVRTERALDGGEFTLDYRVAETGRQRLAVTVLQPETRPACRFIFPLLDTRDGNLFRPQVLARTGDLALWTVGPTWKILRDDRVETGPPNPVLSLQAARNQTRALQVVVSPERPPLRNLSIEVGDLVSPDGRLPRGCLSHRVVGYVTIREPSDATTFPGEWPDPLLPPAPTDAPDRSHAVFWLTLSVPRDARPGLYEAPARLTGEDSRGRPLAQEFRVRLRVLNYALPDVSRLPVEADVWHGWGIYRKLYSGIPLEAFQVNVRAHRIAGTGRIKTGTREETIAGGREYYGRGFRFSWFPVQFLGAGDWKGRRKWGDIDLDPDDPAFAAAFTGRVRELAGIFREQGWLDETALWIWDEPFWEQDAVLRDKLPKLCRLVRQAAPDLPIFLSHPPVPELSGLVDIWCPALHFGAPDLSRQAMDALHARGERLWLYHNEMALVDLPAINTRILPWIVRHLRADGLIWWSINFWGGTGSVEHLDPWTEGLGPRRYRHGDGWFLYPTPERDGILDSLRWELFREGLNDYDTLSLLEERLAEATRTGGAPAGWAADAEQALADAAGMVTGARDFSEDAAGLETIVARAESLLDTYPAP